MHGVALGKRVIDNFQGTVPSIKIRNSYLRKFTEGDPDLPRVSCHYAVPAALLDYWQAAGALRSSGNRFSRNTWRGIYGAFRRARDYAAWRGFPFYFCPPYPTVTVGPVHVTNEHTRHVHARQTYWTRASLDPSMIDAGGKVRKRTARNRPDTVHTLCPYVLAEYRATLTSTSARVPPRERRSRWC